jgi:hypothetical protein
VGVSTGDSVMMGRQTGDQSQLFYLLNLETRIPARHLLRRINPIVTRVLADLREKLKAFYREAVSFIFALPWIVKIERRAASSIAFTKSDG